jgi:hypothetical protein
METRLVPPAAIAPHDRSYKDRAWADYSIEELGMWVHLLVKRAQMRSDPDKARKDLYDARNYAAMIQAHLDEADAGVDKAFGPKNP